MWERERKKRAAETQKLRGKQKKKNAKICERIFFPLGPQLTISRRQMSLLWRNDITFRAPFQKKQMDTMTIPAGFLHQQTELVVLLHNWIQVNLGTFLANYLLI